VSQPLDPEFERQCQIALAKVSTKSLGPIEGDRVISDLGLDSVSVAELLFALEDQLDITLELTEIEQLNTFGDLQELIQRRLAESTA
jgi:acyl carrier protein